MRTAQLQKNLLRVFLLLLPSTFAYSESFLFFPIDKAQFKKLPQQFEYEIIDAEHLRIGDLLIDATKVKFELSPATSSDSTFATFEWPASLTNTGDLIIQDNVGKALWKKAITPRSTLIKKRRLDFEGHKDLRMDQARMQIKSFDPEVIKLLHGMPFFRFCIHQSQEKTQIYLCSRDLYFPSRKEPLKIKARQSRFAEPMMEINGRILDTRGTVFLQDANEILSMHSYLASGASLDIDTRMGPIDLRDVYQTEDHRIIVEATGSDPTDSDKIISRGQDTWSTELEREIPALYVKGEGGIPLRQEFLLKGQIRPQSLQIKVLSPNNLATYGTTLKTQLLVPEGVRLTPYDNNSSLTVQDSHVWNWTLTNLQLDSNNRRFLRVSQEDSGTEAFVGGLDILRSRRNEVHLDFGFYPLMASLDYRFWLQERWGLEVQAMNYIQKGASELGFIMYGLGLNYRLTPSLISQSYSSTLGIGINSISTDQFTFQALSLQSEVLIPIAKRFNQFFDRSYIRLSSPISPLSSTYSTGISFHLQYILQKKFDTFEMGTGLGYDNFTFSYGNSESDFRRLLVLFELNEIF